MAASRDALTTNADEPILSFTQLYQQQCRDLTRLAYLLTGDKESAEDLVQEAFISLHRKWDQLGDPARAGGYLRVSLVNKTRSYHRRRLVRLRHREPAPGYAPSADTSVLLDETQRELVAAVATLPRRAREVIVLRYWGQMSQTEIATSLGISLGAVKSTTSRAMDALATQLRQEQMP